MKSRLKSLHYVTKSKFVRSIFIPIVAIFLIALVVIVLIVFFSFTSEINKNIVMSRQQRLDVIKTTISERMEEAASIGYNIGADTSFYTEPVEGSEYTGYEMYRTLERYLVGNSFVRYLAFYRLSEPDMIYTSQGEMTYHDFWQSYLTFDEYDENTYLEKIKECTNTELLPLCTSEKKGTSYFTYCYALPQFTDDPQAYILMYIPRSEIDELLNTQIADCSGVACILDQNGNMIYETSSMDVTPQIQLEGLNWQNGVAYLESDGETYMVQQSVSAFNGWTYVSVIHKSDMVSAVAGKQIMFIILLFVLMSISLTAMFACIIVQYKPINLLAMQYNKDEKNSKRGSVIDEGSLLSDTFATLKVDSDQKQHYELAFHEAEAANKAKSIFLSNMSHDIRTPMNAIIGMTEIALKHLNEPEYARECLDKVQVASQYLLDIINNVLDMSRIESGRFTLAEEVVELPRLVNRIVTILSQNVESKKLKLSIEVDDIINEQFWGDNVRLTQVFMNILSNAVKFTTEGGTISLHMKQEASTVAGYGDYIFTFKDTGIGMPEDFVDQVFDTFSRAKKSTVSKIEGTGLGMAIAKNLVEMMGGSIKCDSILGAGTTFTVKLHMKISGDGLEKRIEEYTATYGGQRVLIYGNELRVCINQKKLFDKFHVNTEYATDLTEAVRMKTEAEEKDQEYQYIIINQSKHDKSGIFAMSELCLRKRNEGVAYVLVAENLVSVDRSAAVNVGMGFFVQRPLFPSTVEHILDRNCEMQNAFGRPVGRIPDLTNKRILVVEDNQVNREIAGKLISETHAEIEEATNGKEGVELFAAHEEGYFDVILMDLQMPVMNGYEATIQIRDMDRADASTIPIYALTASTFDEDVRQVKEAGMNGHIGKPYVPEELFRALENAVLDQGSENS